MFNSNYQLQIKSPPVDRTKKKSFNSQLLFSSLPSNDADWHQKNMLRCRQALVRLLLLFNCGQRWSADPSTNRAVVSRCSVRLRSDLLCNWYVLRTFQPFHTRTTHCQPSARATRISNFIPGPLFSLTLLLLLPTFALDECVSVLAERKI